MDTGGEVWGGEGAGRASDKKSCVSLVVEDEWMHLFFLAFTVNINNMKTVKDKNNCRGEPNFVYPFSYAGFLQYIG